MLLPIAAMGLIVAVHHYDARVFNGDTQIIVERNLSLVDHKDLYYRGRSFFNTLCLGPLAVGFHYFIRNLK